MSATMRDLVTAIRVIAKRAQIPEDIAFRVFVENSLLAMAEVCGKRAPGQLPGFHLALFPKVLDIEPGKHRPKNDYGEEMSRAFWTYVDLVRRHEPYADLLIELHAEFIACKGGEGLGQFFTPPDLCSLTMDIAVDYFSRYPTTGVAMHDPCCGAGGTVLASVRHALCLHPPEKIRVDTIDIDPFCSSMTTLQLHANQMIHGPIGDVTVRVGNTLVYDTYRTAYLSKFDGSSGWQSVEWLENPGPKR